MAYFLQGPTRGPGLRFDRRGRSLPSFVPPPGIQLLAGPFSTYDQVAAAGRHIGLGDYSFPSGGNIAQGGTSGALLGISVAQSTGSAIAGGIAGGLAAIAPFTGPAAPFLAIAAALVGPIAKLFSGCGQTCTQATQFANQAASALDQMKAAYFAQPVRYKSSQTAALSYFDQIAGWLQQACSNPALGDAGRRCISERLVHGGTAPWCPTGTGCDWITAYRDPIANDAGVVPDPPSAAISSTVDSISNALGLGPITGGAGLPDWVLPLGLIALALIA